MRLSLAPIYPYGTRPVAAAAAGAGVQFAADPIHVMRTRDSLPALTMQDRTGTGSVAFDFPRHGAARLDMTGRRVAGHGSTSHPRHGLQFSRLAIASLGWARQCSAGRGNIATRGDIAGQFSEALPGMARPDKARHGNNATQSGIWINFSSLGGTCLAQAGPGKVGHGNTSPGTVIPDTFPSTKKHPLHAGQRSKG